MQDTVIPTIFRDIRYIKKRALFLEYKFVIGFSRICSRYFMNKNSAQCILFLQFSIFNNKYINNEVFRYGCF